MKVEVSKTPGFFQMEIEIRHIVNEWAIMMGGLGYLWRSRGLSLKE